jgi:putative ABC transport system substrate-binding protein
MRAIESGAPSFGVEIASADLSEPGEIEKAIAAEHEVNGGAIITVSPLSTVNRDRIIALAARYKVPAVYPLRYFAASGGLISYGPDRLEPYRRAAVYVDRILRGEKPAELPVQAPTKYELVINLKTANALGLAIPPTLLALADDVIE